ncbi:putative Glutamine amidotransferase type-2 domain-containing protein [Seiridium cardinale]|uniref:Glutamine amidotransferase type-2 domain-containing protein n=1 Tax=Seiridium cardinale TaxID=138064 RepID=A0ABR2XQX7_9PEZI
MCGLSAIITLERRAHGDENGDDKSRDELRSRLSSSLDLIKHRGPDAQDIWINLDNSVALGHCRLSIVDLSPQGEQPLHDDEGHIHAVVMGEIYDDDVLRERCIQKFGYKFRGHSDSELVIALYKHYGAPAFLEHLRGEYAFVIYDDRSGEIIAARDRFGVKPLFWTRVGNTLLVAAEMKAFIPLGWIPEWNVNGIALSSCFVGSDTIFKDVYRLRPGYYLTASPDGRVGTHEYWDIHYRDKREIETRSVDEMVMSVREKIIESVRVRLRADVPVGIYLSGGIDSSAIAGITKYLVEEKGQRIGSQDIKKKLACFTIQFDKDSGFDESEIAERTANFLGVDVYVKNMNEAAMVRHFEDCIWHNEHHCWDLGTVGKFALSELPRENGFKVILSGEGADELFAGYQWFVPEFLLETDQSSPDLPLQRDDDLRRRLGEKAGQDILGVFSRVGTDRSDSGIEAELKLRLNKVGSPASMATRLTPREIFVPSLQTRYSSADVVRGVIDAWSPSAQEKVMNDWHPVHTSMYAWSKCQLPNYILTALGDRCEMAHSIEGRPPFLDHQLADLMGSIPPSLKMYYGPQGKGPDAGNNTWWHNADAQAAAQFWEKWILREAVKPFITEELYLRRKHFYSAPVLWPRDGPLHSLFKRLLTEEHVRALGFVDWPEIRKSLEQGFGEKADLSATRKCIIVGSFVTLSKRFGVPRARVEDNIIV